MPDTLFNADDTNTVLDQDTNYLAELVGEDKKFKTVDDLAKGKAASDAFIAKLQEEQRVLREELATRIKYEEFLDKLDSATRNSFENNQDDHEPDQSKQSVMKPEDIERLLDQKLRQREQQSTAMQNLNTVKAKLNEVFGPNYALRLKEQANQLGVTPEFLDNLAATQPKAFYRLLNIDSTRKVDNALSPPRSEVNFVPNTGPKKDWNYYSDLRKKDPNLYWSPRIQNEIFNMEKERFSNS